MNNPSSLPLIRSFAFTLALFLSAPASAASLDCALLSRWGERGLTRDMVAAPGTVVAADGRGVAVYDVRNPDAIRQTGTLRTLAPSRAIDVTPAGYVVLTDRGLELIRVASGSPSRIGSSEERLSYTALDCEENVCAAAGTSLDLYLVTANGFARSASVVLSAPADAITFHRGAIFVSAGSSVLEVFDAQTLAPLASLPAVAFDFVSIGNTLYAASGGAGITVLDAAVPASATIRGRIFSGDRNIRLLRADGEHLIAFDALAREILRLDSLDPASPSISARTSEDVTAFAVDGDRFYVADVDLTSTAARLEPGRAFTIRSTSSLGILGEFADRGGPLSGVATDGSFAYVADPPLFRVIDIRDQSRPREVARIAIDDSADRVRLQNGIALVYGRANVHMIDVATPSAPRYLGVYHSLGNTPNGASFAGPWLIEDNRASGFHVVDVSDPANPRQIGGLRNDFYGQFYGVIARPGAAYGFANLGLKVIDLSDPANPRVDHVIPTSGILDAEIAAPTAGHPELLLVLDAGTLRVFDITEPIRPVEIGTMSAPDAFDLVALADVAYLASTTTLSRVNISDGSNPQITHTIEGLTRPTQVALTPDGGRVLVADGYSLLVLRDLAAADAPVGGAPVLSAGAIRLAIGRVTWTPSNGAQSYEIQTSASADFAFAESSVVDGLDADIRLHGGTHVRVRGTNGCAAGDWSNVVLISPDTSEGLVFATDGQTVFLTGSGNANAQVGVVNRGGSPARITLTSSSQAITIQQPGDIPGSSTGVVNFTINPTGLADGATLELTLAGSPSVHVVTVRRLTLRPSLRAAGNLIILPGVASTPGSNGTVWKSDLNLLCRGEQACAIEVAFAPYGSLTSPDAVTLTLAGGEAAVFSDVIASVFGKTSVTGALEIRSENLEALLVSGATYNEGGVGRYGQRLTSRRISSGAPQHPRRLHNVSSNDTFRTNVGLVNGSSSNQIVRLELFDASGAAIGSSQMNLRPWEGVQFGLSVLFPGVTSIGSGYIVVDAPAAVLAYQSRIDQRTGDATFALAEAAGAEVTPAATPRYVRTLAVAVKTPGANNTFWRTALQVVGSATHAQDFEMTFVPSVDATLATSREFRLDPGQAFSTDDIFSDFPGVAADAYGWLRVESDAPFTGAARIYNDAAGGTFGQAVPLVDSSLARRAARTPSPFTGLAKQAIVDSEAALQIFPVGHSAERRTNLGVAEVGGKPSVLRLKVMDGQGVLLGVAEYALAAFASQPIFDLLPSMGLSGVDGLRIEVENDGEGTLSVYASRVEAATGDAVYIQAE
jgi:hypothetical protein